MKVLHVTNMWPSPAFPDNGTYVRSLVDALTERGIENDVLAIDAWKTRFAYASAMLEFRRRVRSSRPDNGWTEAELPFTRLT